MDLQRLSTGDRVIGISGVLLFLFSFLDWLGLEATGSDTGLGVPATSSVAKSAWAFPVTVVAVLVGVVMVAIVVAKLFGVDVPRPGPLSLGQALLLLGAVACFLVAIKLAVGPSEWSVRGQGVEVAAIERLCKTGPNCQDFTTTREVGMVLAVLAAGGLLVGGYLRNQEDTAPVAPAKARATA